MSLPENAESVAVAACPAGGRYLETVFEDGDTGATHLATDARSSADLESEERMLDVVLAAFPDHTVDAEESGVHAGDDRYRWVVDPLDGTNNFEAGVPSFATAVTLLVDGEAELAVVHVPITDDLYVCRRGEGLRYAGERVDGSESPTVDPEAATVTSVIGHDVKRDAEASAVSARIDRGIEGVCKRRLESWSPTVNWGLLARGRLDGAVVYRPDAEELLLGELFAAAAGLETARGEAWFVAAGTADLRAELVGVVEAALEDAAR